MVSISKITTSIALVSGSAIATPISTRQLPDLTCVLQPAVPTALACVITCLSNTTAIPTCDGGCVTNLVGAELVS